MLLANHERARWSAPGIVKNGVMVVEAFNEGCGVRVRIACERRARGGPCVRAVDAAGAAGVTPRGDVRCAHSLPGPAMMARFDASILDRELEEGDYAPRQGSAHMMVWGRGYDHDQIEDLVERWGVNMFVLGHEKAENGVLFIPPAALVINSDHERGVYLPIDLLDPPRADQAAAIVQRLSPTARSGSAHPGRTASVQPAQPERERYRTVAPAKPALATASMSRSASMNDPIERGRYRYAPERSRASSVAVAGMIRPVYTLLKNRTMRGAGPVELQDHQPAAGSSTRRNSAMARDGSCTLRIPKAMVSASNDASSKGSAMASPST